MKNLFYGLTQFNHQTGAGFAAVFTGRPAPLTWHVRFEGITLNCRGFHFDPARPVLGWSPIFIGFFPKIICHLIKNGLPLPSQIVRVKKKKFIAYVSEN